MFFFYQKANIRISQLNEMNLIKVEFDIDILWKCIQIQTVYVYIS